MFLITVRYSPFAVPVYFYYYLHDGSLLFLVTDSSEHLLFLITVLDGESQYSPEVVVVRRGAVGVLGGGRGGGSTG